MQQKITVQTLSKNHPDFFDSISDNLMVNPYTPNFSNLDTNLQQKQTIDLNTLKNFSEMSSKPSLNRFPNTRLIINNMNGYKRNTILEQKIAKFMEDNKEKLDPFLLKFYQENKKNNQTFINQAVDVLNKDTIQPIELRQRIQNQNQQPPLHRYRRLSPEQVGQRRLRNSRWRQNRNRRIERLHYSANLINNIVFLSVVVIIFIIFGKLRRAVYMEKIAIFKKQKDNTKYDFFSLGLNTDSDKLNIAENINIKFYKEIEDKIIDGEIYFAVFLSFLITLFNLFISANAKNFLYIVILVWIILLTIIFLVIYILTLLKFKNSTESQQNELKNLPSCQIMNGKLCNDETCYNIIKNSDNLLYVNASEVFLSLNKKNSEFNINLYEIKKDKWYWTILGSLSIYFSEILYSIFQIYQNRHRAY